MVTFGMGWLLPMTQRLTHVEKVRKFGAPAPLLAWVPLIGDALCLAAGWLRLNPWQALLFMLIGKFARYGVIATAMSYPLSK
jgi:membrane protein YqaA with SNARE-associated domain